MKQQLKSLVQVKPARAMQQQQFIKLGENIFVDAAYAQALRRLGLTSIDAVFSFTAGDNLTKENLPSHRSRLRFQIQSPGRTLFMKRYYSLPVRAQLANWFCRRKRVNFAGAELLAARRLAEAGINTPHPIAWGAEWGTIFERRSFIVTEKIPNAASLEAKLPDYLYADAISALQRKRRFIKQLATFIAKFHCTGYRHRDLYLAHIFRDGNNEFYLIDLARAFKPALLKERYRIKDIAQLHYSSPAGVFSRTDRLRFYLAMACKKRISHSDKKFIRKVLRKAKRMAEHDRRHGRAVPYES